jgi:hypothetical protein
MRGEMPLKSGGAVGVTLITQQRPSAAGSRDTARLARDRWDGAGSTGPFMVRSRPIVRDGETVVINGQSQVIEDSLVVYLDNVEQIEGADYLVNYDAGRIEFLRVVLPTSIVVADYYYRMDLTGDVGDKSVVGLDGSVPIGRNLSLVGEVARSSSAASGSGSGTAISLALLGDFDRFDFRTLLTDVQPSFSRIDTVGFQRDESGLNFTFDWEPSEFVTINGGRSRSRSSQGYTFGYSPYAYSSGYETGAYYEDYGGGWRGARTAPGRGFLPSRQQVDESRPAGGYDTISSATNLSVSLDYPRWPSVDITFDEMSNSGSSRGGSSYGTLALDLDYSPAEVPFSVRLGLERNRQSYGGGELPVGGSAASFAASRSVTNAMRSTVTYNDPGGKFSVATNWNTNRSSDRDLSGRASSAQTLQVSASYNPTAALQIRADYGLSQSDGTVASSLYSGYGTGYGIGWGGGYGSGFGGGYDTWGGSGGGFTGGYGTIAGRRLWARQAGDAGDTTDGLQGTSALTRNSYTSRQAAFDITYAPSERLSLQLGMQNRLYRSSGSVGYAADSQFNQFNLGMGYRFENGLSLSANLGRDTTDYFESGTGSISNNLLNVALDYAPQRSPFSVGLSYTNMTGSSPLYSGLPDGGTQITATSFRDISGRLGYRIGEAKTIELSVGRSRFSSAFDSNGRTEASLAFRYKLSEMLSADLAYQLYKYSGQGSYTGRQTGDYTANILAASLTANFQSGYGGAGGASRGDEATTADDSGQDRPERRTDGEAPEPSP